MIKMRLRFSKSGNLRFIGHLDFLKVFQQTLGRSKLPVAYSQGFNPHMLLSFALPLPLGMTSIHDYADLTLDTELPEDKIISRINACAPGGLVVSGAQAFGGPGAAALVVAADYILLAELDADDSTLVEDRIKSVLSSESIIIPKKTKSGIKDTDIRPDIMDISMAEQHIKMRLAAGSARFLNPLIVAGLLLGRDASPATITRTELYCHTTGEGDEDAFIPLLTKS
ncbi:MAG: TIGR03936 family radical SAM-associated protein [Defluviitaleaceae bacterium]|nr:TIGR03936 family radical SAM-associated protein [Defluviitaleaceae bacterium]